MWNLTNGAARELATDINPDDRAELERLQRIGVLVTDDRRRRPRYFDGRFLAARDLTREQQYFLSRQADLARAGGSGVSHGLTVHVTSSAGNEIVIQPGHGVTVSGELVVLPRPLPIQLANLGTVDRLDATFGLRNRPSEPPRTRSGLYVLALRPVEFTANPIAAYPSSIGEARTTEDGDVVQGVVATLVPYPDDASRGDVGMRRARAAREVFVEGASRGLPVDALPLAMMLLDRGVVRWVDTFMVRRELGAAHGDALGFSLATRAVREAYLIQYESHLQDVVRDRDNAQRGRRFAATEHFHALPPAGRMPADCVDPRDFTQSFFPSEMDVELSIVPDDEMPVLLEDSELLPPIDLMIAAEAHAATSVVILLPLPRNEIRLLRQTLAQAAASNAIRAALQRPTRLTAPGLIARRPALETLIGMRIPQLFVALPNAEDPVDAAWRGALSNAAQRNNRMLWYVRRRTLRPRTELAGRSVRMVADDIVEEQNVNAAMQRFSLGGRWTTLRNVATTAAEAEAQAFMASPKMTESKLLTLSAVQELENAESSTTTGPILPLPAVAKVIARFNESGFGDGLGEIERRIADDLSGQPSQVENLIQTIAFVGVAPELDRIAIRLQADPAALDAFIVQLEDIARMPAGEARTELRTFIDSTLEEISP
jgi:hypothetical protein